MRAERFKVVSALDPALDVDTETLIKYVRERDYALVERNFLPGSKPIIFHVREVPHGMWESYVAAGASEAEQARRAFIAGVEKVENLMSPDGLVQTWTPTRTPRDKVVMMTEEQADLLFRPQQRGEIGMVIYQHSFLPLTIELNLPLLPSWHAPLARLAGLRAERIQSSVSATSSDPPSARSSPLLDATAPD